ncbi:hypothetical protein ASPZODRAFT_20095 [Penicilliopsis zonata CBS 506.65]|uniref:glutathione transferase n=1 Tax=Penicilliopsis zonata CBS 506.65 TaxID=1073090 RepID=A0A1L9S6N4_9EURO|nr:hypothetical protein ASPZODRAFT_20095 [Penicilliopsis zonata CBS 506.65]OJJ42817.1 hypothetical protein ASPZODRAFT_20095 [Penicilliopsis zonata CBS 506.65]
MKLYCFPFSTCTQRVRTILTELGLNAELITVDLIKGAHKEEEYLANFHPFGKVPVLVDGEIQIFESRAICQYLATKHGSSLSPSEMKRYAAYQQALSIEQSYFDPPAHTIAFEMVIKPRKKLGEPDMALVQRSLSQLDLALQGYERLLSRQTYLAGGEVTLADLYHLPYGVAIEPLGYTALLDKYPAVKAWWGRLKERESWIVITK